MGDGSSHISVADLMYDAILRNLFSPLPAPRSHLPPFLSSLSYIDPATPHIYLLPTDRR
jgi:hypothetical protein